MLKRIREIRSVRRSLIEQVELLNKASRELKYDEGLSSYSQKVVQIYKTLELPFLIVGIALLLNLLACFVVLIYKFFR